MHRQKATFRLAEGEHRIIKQRMLDWANQFSILIFLDNNDYQITPNRYECLVAVDAIEQIGGDTGLNDIASWHTDHHDWLFGHIAYDYKNLLEPKLNSGLPVQYHYPVLNFFCPRTVCYITADKTQLVIESLDDPREVFKKVSERDVSIPAILPRLSFSLAIDQEQYLDTIDKLRRHIYEGDCYEINFCNAGRCEGVDVTPLDVFRKLNEVSPAPFTAYYRNSDQYMMCASPERYLFKDGSTILSQPIKGTARRDPNATVDDEIKAQLSDSIKDKAENVMIVDLVRNDLARSCTTGSVRVDELFGIYSFPQVHQMISTISGQLKDAASFTDAIRYSFPMGSMTGAPKVKVMELIEQYEQVRRGLFSGTVGYITPEGDFDFNVVIRSLFYNTATRLLSYQTGGAITYDSDPLKEWEEMRLKAWALERIFS